MFESDTIQGFIDNMISWLIEHHDPDVDGSSTGGCISLYQQLKDQVWENIPFSWSRGRHVADKMTEIAGDDDNGYNVSSQIEELANEINRWK